MKNEKVFCLISISVMIFLFSNCKFADSKIPIEKSADISEKVDINLIPIHEFTIEPTDEVSIDRVQDIAVFNRQENKTAWVNRDKNEVFVTDIDGNHLYNFGSTGEGPEEFLEIFSIGFDSHDNIIVYDAKLDLFKKFEDPGILIESYDGVLDHDIFTYSRKLLYSDENLYLAVMETDKANQNQFWKSSTIGKFDHNHQLVDLFGSYDPEIISTTFLYKFPMLILDTNYDNIYSTHRTHPFVLSYDLSENTTFDRFGIISSSFLVSENEATPNDPVHIRRQKNLSQSFVEESFVSEQYFFLQHSTYSEDTITYGDTFLRQSFLNVFEKNEPYRFLGEIELNSIPIYITSKNQIYVLKDNDPDNFTVGLYEITVEY